MVDGNGDPSEYVSDIRIDPALLRVDRVRGVGLARDLA